MPPPFSRSRALERDKNPHSYSLGLWDVGMVQEPGGVEWHSVWVIASERYFGDLNQLSAGGRPYKAPTTPAQPPRPGWLRAVNMYDALSGKSFI